MFDIGSESLVKNIFRLSQYNLTNSILFLIVYLTFLILCRSGGSVVGLVGGWVSGWLGCPLG